MLSSNVILQTFVSICRWDLYDENSLYEPEIILRCKVILVSSFIVSLNQEQYNTSQKS